MARSLPVENLLPQNVGSIINYLRQFTEVAQWGAPSCSRAQPVTENCVRDGKSNCLVSPPPNSWAVLPELHALHCVNATYKLQNLLHRQGLEHASTDIPDQRTS